MNDRFKDFIIFSHSGIYYHICVDQSEIEEFTLIQSDYNMVETNIPQIMIPNMQIEKSTVDVPTLIRQMNLLVKLKFIIKMSC
jgi:hypothetical protein